MKPNLPYLNAGHLRSDLAHLKIGSHFTNGGGEWIVTDIGTRTLSAIKLEPKMESDPSWLAGPPYAVAEIVFDEDDILSIETPGD
ncbi:hypothetical protein [Mesorhizobium sp. SP-1A]|uniref:hypothetical protein n=1 Tax=Mesorhizobium sp. SP-1A TaxID=3077840 RepID=UPI0028F6EF15|nr:hypothetical protein [Mesorhizobium sp. SP-1A]